MFGPEDAAELARQLLALASDRPVYERLRAACRLSASKFDRSSLAINMLHLLSQASHPTDAAMR
jgi:hypothetical protein